MGGLPNVPEQAKQVIVRVAVFGQINAGKSSLINSLLSDVQANVSEEPMELGVKEFRLQSPNRPELVLVDTPGLNGNKKNEKIMLKEAEKADLILWVVSATQPARSIDHDALKILKENLDAHLDRKSPPIIFVMTHVDRLSPSRDWEPPYDIESPLRAKAKSIREALNAVSSDLLYEPTISVPVSLRQGSEPYNIDALWVAMTMNLEVAKHAAIDRARREYSPFNVSKLYSQVVEGGRFLIAKGIDGFKRNL